MKLFVTGATGFMGRHTVVAALERGHEVTALARTPPSGDPWDHPAVHVVTGDLRAPSGFAADLADADAIIHLAAAKTGDLHAQMAGTVLATEAMLAALPPQGRPRLVHVSTFSVYDYDAMPVGATLSEESPTETDGADRDAYTQTKLLQEQLVREHADRTGRETVVVRPGAVWGAGELWGGGTSLRLGRFGVAIGPRSALKLTYVENCVEAIVLAAEAPAAPGTTLNIVDDEQPTQAEFAAALRAAGADIGPTVGVPYRAAHGLAVLAELVRTRALGGRARTPALLSPARLAASRRHHEYENGQAKRVLGWSPRYGLAEAAERAADAERSAVR